MGVEGENVLVGADGLYGVEHGERGEVEDCAGLEACTHFAEVGGEVAVFVAEGHVEHAGEGVVGDG